MNRATADNQSAQAEEEGLEPTKAWVKDLCDEIIAEEFASPDLELAWLGEDDSDSKSVEAALESRLKLGALTLNELRDALGLDPYANPAADRPMVLTNAGYVPIEANADGRGAGAQSATDETSPVVARRALIKDYNPNQPRVPVGSPDGGQWTDGGIQVAQNDTGGKESDAIWPSGGKGHHWVPRAVFNKKQLQPETWQVFEDATSGPLPKNSANRWAEEHMNYNTAVEKVFNAFLESHNISSERMTPDQARELIQEVRESGDPRIRGLNTKIMRERLRYIRVFGPEREGGDED